VTGKVSYPITDEPDEEAEPTILVDEVVPLSDAVRRATRAVVINLDATETRPEQLESLKSLLADSPGACPVDLVLALPEGARAVMTIEGTRVDPSDAMLSGLERLFGGTVTELR
jgi:DNA polymerase-3 subunit alpha